MFDDTPNHAHTVVQQSDIMALTVPLWVFDIDRSCVVWANESARKLWHADTFEELYERDMGADMSSSIAERLTLYQSSFEHSRKVFKELWTLYPNGTPQTYQIEMRGHRLPDGRMALFCEAKSQEHHLPERARSAEALNHIPVSITLFTLDGTPLYTNTEALNIYTSASVALGERFVHEEDYLHLISQIHLHGKTEKICLVNTTMGQRWHEISARSCRDAISGERAIILSEVDVTGLKEQEQKISFLAHHDILTGLNSRYYVNTDFPKALRQSEADGQQIAMLLIDLDNFKTINDTLGHISGDLLLVHVAGRLQMAVGDKGQLARLGGDEFVMLVPFESQSELDAICDKLLEEIASECRIGDHHISSKASIGIALSPEHGKDVSTLMRHADLALYEAKDTGRNTYCYFRPALQQAALLKRTLEKDLHRAIKENEFLLYYQPRVDCHHQTVLSAEALIRWKHPEQGIVPPGLFIETLEETGMIHQVGDWLIEQAGRDQRHLARQGFDIPISINISPKQFARPDFVARLKSNLAKTHCPADRIEIEITEGMLMGDGFDAKAVLMDLRNSGFSIAVDDFGTGYSNLAYIQEYPISSLKVDRSFIKMIEERSSVVNMILSLCRLIGITAVAEGVETVDQLEWLMLNHCDQYQGYLYSRPVPMAELMDILCNPPTLVVSDPFICSPDPEVAWA